MPENPAVSSAASTLTVFYSQKLWGLTFLVLEPWAGWSGVGVGSFAPKVYLLIFIQYAWVWYCLFHISAFAPPTHLDEFDFFNSLVVGLPYSLIFWVIAVL